MNILGLILAMWVKIRADEIYILIGPEGGFDKFEIDILVDNNWHVESLGKRKPGLKQLP